MSVVSRLLNRRLKSLLAFAQDGKEFPGYHQLRSKSRLLSTPAKPAPDQTATNGTPKSEPPLEGAHKTQNPSTSPPPPPPKPQTPQSTPPPGQKPQIPQSTPAAPHKAAAPTPQPKPVQKVHQGQPLPAGSKVVQRPQVGPQRPVARVGQGATGAIGHKTPVAPGGGGGRSVSKTQSRLKVSLASGLVGGLVLGLLYWQSPKLHHNGALTVEDKDKGKDDTSGGQLPEEVDKPEERVDVIEIPESGEKGDEPVLKEPEAVKVETSFVDPGGDKQENSSAPDHVEVETKTEEVITRVEPEAETTLEKIVIEFEPREESQREEARQADESVVHVTEDVKEPTELSESYLLQRGHETVVKEHDKTSDDKETSLSTGLNIVTVIHAAEQRQAAIDAQVYREQLQLLEEKHHRELKVVEREASNYSEQVRRLQQGMETERQRHSENLKSQQKQADVTLQERLKLMEEATQRQLEEAELLAKAEAANALIQERVSFLSDIGSVKVHMEAMNIALDAKSEEAREGHEIKQLSVGSFAFEDALLTGAPVDKEAAVLLKSTGGDPLVEVALKSLPKEVLEMGTLTPAQLDRKLEEIEGTLRELALIPASGGGVLCHLIARLATLLKLPDHGIHDDWGVDAVISQVQAYIRDGDLLDAAEAMSRGMSGTNAEQLALEWASQARNRAVLEQACALLRAHAAALALGDYNS